MTSLQDQVEALQLFLCVSCFITIICFVYARKSRAKTREVEAALRSESSARLALEGAHRLLDAKYENILSLYQFSENNVADLRDQIANMSALSARIRHDVPKRLNYIWKYLQAKLPEDEYKKQAIEDIAIIFEKIQIHANGDIESTVRESFEKQQGVPADGMRAEELVQWLLRIHRCESRTKVLVQHQYRLRGPRVSWDLMLTNVLSNAIHYAGDNGKIRIVLSQINELGCIEIINEGPHIPNADREKVFNAGFSTKPGGRGLGLHVASDIARGMNAKMLVPENLGVFKKRVKFSIVDLPIYPAGIAP